MDAGGALIMLLLGSIKNSKWGVTSCLAVVLSCLSTFVPVWAECPVTASSPAKKLFSSYYRAAEVFRDKMPNHAPDASEKCVTTDAQGRLMPPSGKGRLYLRGGIHVETGQPNNLILSAAPSARAIGILTALWQALLDRKLSDGKVRKLLFLPPKTTLANFAAMPVQQIASGAKTEKLVVKNAQQETLVRFLKSLIQDKPGGRARAADYPLPKSADRLYVDPAIDALAQSLFELKLKKLDLADASQLAQLFPRALQKSGVNDLSADQVTTLVTVTSAINAQLAATPRQLPTLQKITANAALVVAARDFATLKSQYTADALAKQVQQQAIFIPAPVIQKMEENTGVSASDGITRDTTPTFIGSIGAGADKVRAYRDGVAVGETSVQFWQWTYTSPALADGNYTLVFKGVNAQGQEGDPSTSFALTVQTTTPATVGVPYQYYVADQKQTGYSFTLTEAPPGMTVDVSTGLIQWTPTALQVGTFHIAVDITDPGGATHTAQFTVVVAGNTINNAPPTIVSTAAVAQWQQLNPAGTPPSPRAYNGASAYDEVNDRLILFGGADGAGQHLNEVWVLADATGISGTPAWLQLHPSGGPPAGRILHSVAYDPTSNRLIIHGGCGGNCLPILGDTWVLTNANGLGGPSEWIALPSTTTRAGHAGGYDPVGNRMVVFGGETSGFPNGDVSSVSVLIDANGIGTPQWIMLAPTGPIPPLRGGASSAVYDPLSNRLMVFGGLKTTGEVYNDLWVLTHANGLGGTPEWTQLTPIGPSPASRGAHGMAYDPGSNRITVFGGIDDTVGNPYLFFDDVWVLSHANGIGGNPAWAELTAGLAPTARAWHSSGYAKAQNRMVITAGRNDRQPAPGVFNDTWLLTNASGNCTGGQACNYDVNATDPDGGDVPSYAIASGPQGMSIEGATGLIQWTPTPDQVGDHAVSVIAYDRGGLRDTQTFNLTVEGAVVPNVQGLAPEWADALLKSAGLTSGTRTSLGGAITLNFDTLPSEQGWSYVGGPAGAPIEGNVFSVGGGALIQNTFGVGGRAAIYEILSGISARSPFSMATRARVTAEEGGTSINHFGFSFGAWLGDNLFDVGLGTEVIEIHQRSSPALVTFDNTAFHDYRLSARPGSSYDLLVDGNLLQTGPHRVLPNATYSLALGDGTEGPNAQAEVTAYSFTQPHIATQNPAPGTPVIPGSAVALGIQEGPATQIVPNVVGKSQADAQSAIAAAGLQAGVITTETNGTVPPGAVIRQKSVAGTHIMPGFKVDLVVSASP